MKHPFSIIIKMSGCSICLNITFPGTWLARTHLSLSLCIHRDQISLVNQSHCRDCIPPMEFKYATVVVLSVLRRTWTLETSFQKHFSASSSKFLIWWHASDWLHCMTTNGIWLSRTAPQPSINASVIIDNIRVPLYYSLGSTFNLFTPLVKLCNSIWGQLQFWRRIPLALLCLRAQVVLFQISIKRGTKLHSRKIWHNNAYGFS